MGKRSVTDCGAPNGASFFYARRTLLSSVIPYPQSGSNARQTARYPFAAKEYPTWKSTSRNFRILDFSIETVTAEWYNIQE